MAISYIQSIGLRQPFCLKKFFPNFDMFIFTSWRSTVQKKSHKNKFLYLLYLKRLHMYEDPNPWIGDDWTQIKFGLGLEKSLSKTSVYTKTFQNITRVSYGERLAQKLFFFHITMKSDHTLHRCTMCVWLFHSVEEYRYYLMDACKQFVFKCL